MSERGPDIRQIIAAIYRWDERDRDELAKKIKAQRYQAYRQKLIELALAVGCSKAASRARPPSGASKEELDRLSEQDAQSIVETWNGDVEREIGRLFAQNPRGNRYFYYKNVEAWARQRDGWKQAQIALMNVQTARNLAREDFGRWNGDVAGEPLYQFSGPPPREAECARLMAMGPVGEEVVRKHPTPRHIGCPHEWQRVQGPGRVRCDELFLG